jgi:hypothetical protein
MPRLFLLLCLLLSFPTLAQPATQPEFHPLTRDQLLTIFQHELGNLYHPDQADTYLAAHTQLENFFSAKTSEDRATIFASLQKIPLDPNTLGRLSRIRSTWPDLTPGGTYYINERVGPIDAIYFLGVPKSYDRLVSWPLVIKLPAPDAFLTNPKPTPNDVQRIYTNWINDELSRHPDAFILMPLLNLDNLYGPSYAGMNSVIGPLLHVPERANIDPARVYLIGHSTSGHATWNIPLHYPTYFAAINPLAGSATGDWQRLRLTNLHNLLVVPWNDFNDPAVKISAARQLVNVLKRVKVDVDYVETKNVGHVPTEEIVEQCYAKLRARTRDLYPKQIFLNSNREEVPFNRIDWLQIYQPTQPGTEQKMAFSRIPGSMLLYANPWSTTATLTPNHLNLATDNVELLRVYMNDQMVDFSKPITITVNKQIRFEGMLKPSIDTMLKDQLILGRGWRYFTASVDIDLSEKPPTTPK